MSEQIVRRLISGGFALGVLVPMLGIVLPEPEYCTQPPGSVLEGQALRCPEPKAQGWDVPLENRVTPEGPAETGGMDP